MADQVLATKFTADVEDALKGIGRIKEAFTSVVQSADIFNKNMAESSSAIFELVSTINQSVAALSKMNSEMAKVGSINKDLTKSLDETKKSQSELNESQSEGERRGKRYSDAAEEITKKLGDNKVALAGALVKLRDLDDMYTKLEVGGHDLSKVFGDQIQPLNMAQKAIDNYAQSANSTKILNEKFSETYKKLGGAVLDNSFKTTELGKIFEKTGNYTESFQKQLVAGVKGTDLASQKTVEFAKALKSVYDHVSSISPTMHTYSKAQDALTNKTSLTSLANSLLKGNIEAVDGGYKKLISTAGNANTVMTSQDITLTKLTNQSQGYLGAVRELGATQLKNGEQWDGLVKRANDYSKAVSQVQSMQRIFVEDIKASGKSYTDLNGNILTTTQLKQKLSSELGVVTNELNKQSSVYDALTGKIGTNTNEIIKHIFAKHEDLLSVQELGKEYFGLNKAYKQLSDYAPVYTDSLKKQIEGHDLSRAAVEYNADAITKYAKTAESLITQNRNIANSLIQVAESSGKYKDDQQGLIDYTNKVNDETRKFENTLRDQKTILESVSSANKNTAEAVLNYAESQKVSKDVTDRVRSGIYELLPPMKGYDDLIGKLNDQIKDHTKNNIQAREELNKEVKSREEAKQKLKEEAEARKKANQIKNDELSITQKLIIKVKELAMYYASAALLYGVTTAVRAAVIAMANFDQTLHSLKAITGATNTEISVLGEVMREVSRDSRYSLAEVGEGLQLMGQAGLDAVQSMNAIKAATDLAVGTLEKMDPVVDLLTTTMTAFYDNMDEASLNSTKIADIFAVAINKSKLSVDKLRTAFNYLGLTAAQTGLSLEETNATLMIMADAGMKASTMGTSFRQVLSRLIAPNQKLREAYEESGVSLSKINPLTAGYESALQGLTGVLWDNEKGVVKTAKAYELFGLRGAQSAIAIVRAFVSGDYHEAMEELKRPGMAAEMAAEQMEGLTAKFENLIARLKDFAVMLGEAGITNFLKALIDVTSGTIEVFRVLLSIDLGGYFAASAVFVLAFMSAFKLLGVVVKLFAMTQLYDLIAVMGVLKGSIEKVKIAFTGLMLLMKTHWILTTISAVVALAAWIYTLSSNTKDHIAKLQEQSLRLQLAAGALDIFRQAIEKTNGEGTVYTELLKQFGEQQKEVTEKILKLTGASSLATVGFNTLMEAIKKIKIEILVESVESAAAALNKLKDNLNVFDYFRLKLNIASPIVSRYEYSLKDLTLATYNLQKNTGKTREEIEKHLKSMELSRSEVKNVVSGMDALIEKNKRAAISYKELQQSGLDVYKNIYKDLTISQKLEMIALEKQKDEKIALLRKQAEEGLLSKAELYAAEQIMESESYIKSLEKRSDFVKKELEIEIERLNREQSLLDEKEDHYLKSLQNHLALKKQFSDELLSQTNKTSEKEKAELVSKIEANEAIIKQTEKNLADLAIYEKRRAFQEKLKVDQAYLDFYKAQLDLETTATAINESDKIKAKIYSSQLDLDLVRKKKDEFVKTYKAEGAEYQKILSEELKARKQVLDDQMTLIDHYLEQIKSKYEIIFTSISNNYELETEIVERNLDLQLQAVESQYKTKEALLESSYVKQNKYYELEAGNESELQKKKIALHLEYLGKTMKIQEDGLNKNLELIERERVETAKAIEYKYAAQLGYENRVLDLKTKNTIEFQGALYYETTLTVKQLQEMGAAWHTYGGKVYTTIKNIEKEVVKTAKEESKTVEEKNKEIVENEIKAYAARKAELEKYFNEVKSKLQEEESLYRELLGKRAGFAKSSNDLEKQYFDDQRTTRQLSMSDYEKYKDDLKRIDELYNEGVKTGSKELLDEARGLMATYSSEQKTASGAIGATLSEVSAKRSEVFTKLYEANKKIIDKEKADNEVAINEIKLKIEELKLKVQEYGEELKKVTAQEFKLNSKQAEDAVKAILTKVEDLKKILNDLEMKINIDPFVRQIQSIETELTKFVADANEKKVEVLMDIVGGTEKEPFKTFWENAKTFVSQKAEEIKAIAIEVKAKIMATPTGSDSDEKPYNEVLDGLVTKAETTATKLAATPMEANVKVQGFDGPSTEVTSPTALLDTVKQKADALVGKTVKYIIEVTGLDTLISAVNYQNQLQDKSVTHTINVHTVHTSSGGGGGGGSTDGDTDYHLGGMVNKVRKFAAGGFSGLLSGYGGGDIIPAWLEPGEFVLRKEAVKKRGLRLAEMFNNLNLSTSDMMSNLFTKSFNFGGAVLPDSKTSSYYPPQQAVNQGTAQTHIIEFKVGNDSYQLKGEGNVVQRMVANMRRSRLVTV